MRTVACVLLCAVVSAPLFAQAQQAGSPAAPLPASIKSSTSRVFFTGALNGSAINFDGSNTTENGSGLSIGVGYGFTPNFAGYVEVAGASIKSEDGSGDYTLAHFDVGARYHFANVARVWIPFLEASLTGRGLNQSDVTVCTTSCTTDDLAMSGAGFSFGGGVMYYATPKLAISADLKWTAGKFTHLEYAGSSTDDLDQKATSTRFGLGVVWFPASK